MTERKSVLWLYTPSNMSKEVLEGIFVGREPIAQQLVDVVTRFAEGEDPKHQLLLGPRGMGKTHLISIVHSRTETLRESKKLTVSWLNEDVSGVYDLLSLYMQIAQNGLAPEAYEAFHRQLVESKHLGRQVQTAQAEGMLRGAFHSTRLLVIIENAQQTLETIGKENLWKLREFLGRSPWLMLFVSATKVFKGIAKSSEALYGSFQMTRLDDLTRDDAVAMMQKVANITGDQEVISELGSQVGRAKIKSIYDFAGGNPRIWAVFADLLKLENLGEVVTWMEQAIDSLTPYYQERFWGAYSHQQRAVLGELLSSDYWLTPKSLSEKLIIPENHVSAILNTMVGESILERQKIGRSSYYTLREPLMRIAYQVKSARDAPIKLIVSVLGMLHEKSDIEKQLTFASLDESRYLEACLKSRSGIQVVFDRYKEESLKEEEFARLSACSKTGHMMCLSDDYVREWDTLYSLVGSEVLLVFFITAWESIFHLNSVLSPFNALIRDETDDERKMHYVFAQSEFAPISKLRHVANQMALIHPDLRGYFVEMVKYMDTYAEGYQLKSREEFVLLPKHLQSLDQLFLVGN